MNDRELKRWKDIFAKSGIVYSTDDEYREAINNLVGYVDTLIEMDQEQKLKQQLKKEVETS